MYLVNDLWPNLPEGTKQLLHIAPEQHVGGLLHEKDDVNYLSGDLFMPNAMVKLDLTDMQFPDDRFHVILCSHILEHIPDDRLAMSEMFRVTKPGCYTIVQVPVYGESTYEDFSITEPEDRLTHFGQADHVRKYGRDITARLAGVGFDVAPLEVARNYPAPLVRYLGLKDQLVFQCRKPAPEQGEEPA
jgi:SAM-dependent methyltransferase